MGHEGNPNVNTTANSAVGMVAYVRKPFLSVPFGFFRNIILHKFLHGQEGSWVDSDKARQTKTWSPKTDVDFNLVNVFSFLWVIVTGIKITTLMILTWILFLLLRNNNRERHLGPFSSFYIVSWVETSKSKIEMRLRNPDHHKGPIS